MAVPPDLVDFAESAGLAAVAYGPDLQAPLEAHRDCWTRFFRNFWRVQDLIKLWREISEFVTQCWGGGEHDADVAGGRSRPANHQRVGFEHLAANVAEYYDIPLATLHYLPVAGQRPAPAIPAGAVGPLSNDGVRVAVLGRRGEED